MMKFKQGDIIMCDLEAINTFIFKWYAVPNVFVLETEFGLRYLDPDILRTCRLAIVGNIYE